MRNFISVSDASDINSLVKKALAYKSNPYLDRTLGFRVQKVEYDTVEIREPHSYQLPVAKLTVLRETQAADGRKVSDSALYVYWFVADEQLTSKHGQRMLWMAKDLISRGILQRWAYISCFTACPPGHEDQTYSRMREWIAAAVPKFQLATGPASVPAANP